MNTTAPLATQRGYSMIELMIALAVGGISIAALYAGYTVFVGYHSKLSALAAADRSALQVLDVLTRDLRVAGYKDFSTTYGSLAGTGVPVVDFSGAIGNIPVVTCGCNPGESCRITTVYDLDSTRRIGVSYYTRTHAGNRATRCRLYQRRDQWTGSTWTRGTEDVVADWVDNIHFVASDLQASGRTYAGLPQMVSISLQLRAPAIATTRGTAMSRTYTTAVRIRNVALVP